MIKTITAFLLTFLLAPNLFAIDYYYYSGGRIQLTQRNDGVAIITNSGKFDNNSAYNIIKPLVSSGDEIIGDNNFFYISFKDSKSSSKISYYTSLLASKSDVVKFVTPVYFGDSRDVTSIPTDEFFIRLRNLKDREKLDILNAKNNVYIIGNINDEYTFYLKTYDGIKLNALELASIYYNEGFCEYAEPNFLYPSKGFFNATPNDPLYPTQWALNNTGQRGNTGGLASFGDSIKSSGMPGADMDVDKAWDYVRGNNSVYIAVFDTGIDSLHSDIARNLTTGYNSNSNNNSNKIDTGSHGTCTLGIIGAISNNSVGVSGICGGDGTLNSNCKMASYRLVTNAGAFVATNLIARAFDTARVRGAHVSSNSWGGGSWSSVLVTAINNCATNSRGGKGTLILFSSGNSQANPPGFPTYIPNVVCVGASTMHDQKKVPGTGNQFWWGGNWGGTDTNDIDVVAPTICMTTDKRGSMGYNTTAGSTGDYDTTFNGTSCACPNAAGVAGLIFSVNPNFTAAQVKDYLYRGCNKIDNVPYSKNKTYGKWNPHFGYGRVNAYNSVRLAAGVDVTPPSINHTNVNSDSSTYPVSVTAIIRDQDGSAVPSTGANRPVVKFRKNKNNAGWSAFDSVYATSSTGDTSYIFKIPGSGWKTEVQYYIRARDNNGNETTFPFNANISYSFTLCYYAIGSTTYDTYKLGAWTASDAYYSTSPNVNVASSFKILETRVQIYLRHTYLNDEYWLYMWSPIADNNNNRKQLFGFSSVPGGVTTGVSGAIVTDTASNTWIQYSQPFSGRYVYGDYTLAGYKGTEAQGNWKFTNYDAGSGDIPNFDSIKFTFKKIVNTTSPCLKFDVPSDSVAAFSSSQLPDTSNFYLKNTGNATLTIGSYNFSGTYSNYYSVINTPPATIAAGDSGLFKIRAGIPGAAAKGSMETDVSQNAALNINTNDPSKPVVSISLQSPTAFPSAMNLKVIPFGFYDAVNNVLNSRDTVTVYLRNTTNPFAVVDSAKAVIDSVTFSGLFKFTNANNGNYYIVIKHRNSLETWSKLSGESFAPGVVQNYDFTTDSAKAYSNNMVKSGAKWCLINGDCNRDGYIDGSDYLEVINSYDQSGYLTGDNNGDQYVDGSDYLPVINNYGIGAVTPLAPMTSREKADKKMFDAKKFLELMQKQIQEKK